MMYFYHSCDLCYIMVFTYNNLFVGEKNSILYLKLSLTEKLAFFFKCNFNLNIYGKLFKIKT